MMLVTASCTSCWSELLKSPGLSLASSSFSGRTLTTAVPRRKASNTTEKSSPSAKGVALARSTFLPPTSSDRLSKCSFFSATTSASGLIAVKACNPAIR